MDFVGTRWYKCDFHLHTMSSECYVDDDSYESWIEEVKKKGLKCIAVTDHNDYRAIDRMKQLGTERGIIVFPGVEVTCDTAKIHLLIIFDVEKTQENVRDFLNRLDIDSDLIGKSKGTSTTVFDVCKLAKEKQAVVIAAHIDDYCSISSMRPQLLQQLLEGDYLDAVQVVNSVVWDKFASDKDKQAMYSAIKQKYGESLPETEIDEWRKTYDKALKAKLPMIAASDNSRENGSSKHGLWGIGSRYTWMKMDKAPSLESIRQAFLSADVRVMLDVDSLTEPEKIADLWIKSLSISDTTINPVKSDIDIEFSPQLNCVIGGRGSGKSSIVRILTGGLQLVDRSSLAIQAEQDNYYKRNKTDLKTGETLGILKDKSKIEIEVVRNAVLYKIVIEDIKSAREQSRKIYRFSEELDDWEEIEHNFLEFMKAQVYTQKEIFEIAKDSEALLKIIDREIEGIAELKNSSDKAFDDIINKKRQIREYEIICEKEQMLRTEISDLDGQITLFKQSGIADQIEAMQSFANEDAEIKRIQSVLNGYETSLKSSLDNLASLELRIDSEKCSSELQTVFSDVSQKVEIELENIALAIAAIRAIRESIDGVLDEAGWSQKRDETKELFEKAKAELKEKNIEVTKLSDLLSSKAQKEKQLQNIEDAKKKQETAHSELKKLISEYNQRVKAIRTARETFVSSVLGQDDTVKIDFIPAANRESFEKMIKELTGKDGTKVNEDIQKLDEIVFGKRGLSEFRTIIRSLRKGQEVKEQFSSVFRKVVPEMDDDNFFRMEEFVPKDELVVSYKPEGSKRFVPLSIASAGQKTTAILTFILAYGDVPLILDQPEDDLDNKLVYELVVKRLKIAKRHRQIIVITHNANIPVNGDAEYITSMDSDSVFVKKKYEGTLDQDEIRSEICDVMEGSEYAFSMRAHKYHLRISK